MTSARPGPALRPALLLLLVCWTGPARDPLAQTVPSPVRTPSGDELILSSDLRVRIRSGRDIELLVRPRPGQDYTAVAERVGGSRSLAAAIEAWNQNRRAADLDAVRVPLALLSPEYRRLVLKNLFPDDHRAGEDWIHVARAGVLAMYDEGLWQVAEWFTGQGARFRDLQQVNRLVSPELRAGQRIRIPASLLHPGFRARPTSDDRTLEYGEDEQGAYAGYRLRAGEALWSSVVVRYTGRTSAEDVTALAEELARRSGIPDPRDIPVEFLVKIPWDVLEPEFLPRDHPARRQEEVERAEMAAELEREPVPSSRRDLDGVLVILDPGHGGRDLGTINHGIWEHDYVYDVACRLKEWLETRTSATVSMTVEDTASGHTPSAADELVANQGGAVLTTPPFLSREPGEAAIGVNLRWYLANSLFRKATAAGTDGDRVVFVSLHADARHPSLRGAMVYVPGAGYRTGTHGQDDETYRRYREVREQPFVRFSHKELVRSEAVSRRLAAAILDAFRREGLPVQPLKPVRDRVIRGRATWLPAVLRGNAVPTKVLVEMLNLSNPEDAALLGRASERRRLAGALGASLLTHFGDAR